MQRNYDQKQKIIVILGPTASGKSDLAVALARRFNGEIISADSRQVYCGMDIGTGKITKKEMRGVGHYLLDVASPKRRFTVVQYKKLAEKSIKEIMRRRKLPIICGGTGFYIQAIIENLQIPKVKPDWKLRTRLGKKSTEELYCLLEKIDPERAKNIDRFNKRRLIRAVEIIKTTGRPIPRLKTDHPYNTLYLGIKKSPNELKKLIELRLQKRFKQGMINEVKNLHKSGVSWKKLEDFGLEYRWIARYLQKKINREEMLARLQKEIEHYTKRQITWFKRNDKIKWLKNKKRAYDYCRKFIKKTYN